MRLLQQALTTWVRGTNDSAAATAYRSGEAVLIENMRLSPEGLPEVRYGSRKAHSTALNSGAKFYGGTVFTTAAGVVQWVVFCGNTAYYSTDEGVTWTQIATTLREDYWSLSTMRVGSSNYLLCVNGGTSGYKWDGTTWSTITNLPSGVKYGAVFNGRFYVAGHNGPIVQGSRIADPEFYAIPSGVLVQVQTHDGDNDITGLFQVGPSLLVFKRNSTNVLDGYGNQDIVVAAGATGLSRSVGCLAPRTLAAAGDQGCLWLSDRGIEYYVPGQGVRLISEKVRGFFESISWGDIVLNPGVPVGVYLPNPGRHEYLCALPAAGDQNNVTVRVHMSLPVDGGFAITFDSYSPTTGGTLYVDSGGSLCYSADGTRNRVRTIGGSLTLASGTQAGLYVEIEGDGDLSVLTTAYDPATLFAADRGGTENSAPIAGGYDGFVRHLEKGTTDNEETAGTGGVAIAGRMRDQPRLFGRPFQRKRARRMELLAVSGEAASVTLALLSDGQEVATKTVSVAAASNGQPKRNLVRINGRGHTLQPEVRCSKAGLKIAGISLEAEILDGAL